MSVRSDKLRRFLGRLARSWIVFAVLGLVVGLLVAPVVFQVTSATQGTVAVVPLEGGLDGGSAAGVSAQLERARSDPSIDAVVLVSNSPGGGASASETLYLEVARTAEQMPVVASVDAMAASGAYYTIAPADYIYAKPSSLVGSVGVFITQPTDPQPIDEVVASGPKKLSGGNERDWSYKTESLRRAFVGAVFASRGDDLTISRTELSEGNLFTGAQAVRNGIADEIGGSNEAIRKAAREAGLDDYRVEVLRPGGDAVFISRVNFVASSTEDKRLVSPTYFVGALGDDPTVPNVLMLPPSAVAAAVDADAADAAGTSVATDGADAATTPQTPDESETTQPVPDENGTTEGGP